MSNPPLTVFISYRRELSVDLAQSIHARLKAAGVDVFIDLDAIDAGEDYELRLERELDQRGCLLVILAPETLNRSTWVSREIASALRRGKKIIPVTTGGYTFSRHSLPPEIADLARYNYIPYEPLYADAAFDKIKRSLGITAADILSATPTIGTRHASSAVSPARTGMPTEVKVAIIGLIGVIAAALIAIVPNLLSQSSPTPPPTTQAVIAPSNTPPPTESPLPPTPTPTPTESSVPPSATPAPTDTPVPPTSDTSQVQIIQQFDAPGEQPNGIACSANGLLLADNSNAIFEIDTSGKPLAVYQSPDPTPTGLGTDGTRFWVQTTARNLIHEFQINGSQLVAGQSFPSPIQTVGGGVYNDMAWDGSSWWMTDQFTLHQLDTTGIPLTPLFFPQKISAVDWDGSYLWLAFTATSSLSVYDRQGNLIQSFPSPIPELQGLAWCGSELWAIGRNTITSPYRVYQLAVSGWSHFATPPSPNSGNTGRIVFISNRDGSEEIYIINADGNNLLRLTANGTDDFTPNWSPDGSQIAYASEVNGNVEIYVMNADGSNQRNITNSPNDDYSPDWSPDGQRIAFHTFRDGNSEIYVMNADGSNPVRLTTNSRDDASPVWSPDGKQIAFDSQQDSDTYLGEIYVINADSTNPVRLTNTVGNDDEPIWSPDGKQIAFVSYRDGHHEIYVMNADGSNPHNLTNSFNGDLSPAWSPDGAYLFFTSNRDNDNNYEIYVMNADGSNPRNLTNNPAYDAAPDIAPAPISAPEPTAFQLQATLNP